ncbi:chitodextrinase/beta-mannanase [Paenibacillus sp. V4I9]|uniref:glycosyl hydrolase n=1 Tax=Paenibacillus sp. V4I9 TaxID=3042308 RepID=UPI0027842674|nr:glycosyl hydrolase [Paenibacillus sp. V4I9]MDQ0890895.1 chitodextrinase/beta-mannanase [Paenibacillus sp. V4I9]
MINPINTNASQKTIDVLNYLYTISGYQTLTGIHNWLEDPDGYVNQIYNLYGDYPGVSGYEMGPIADQSDAVIAAQRQNVTNSAKAYFQNGGIVTMMWHQNYPLTSYSWSNVQRSTTDAEFNRICTPGTAEYNWLISEYDKVAGFLKQLRDANVPVLWRPYHEMNGGWFWWGKKMNYTLLWDIMYNRFTNFHGLNNIIWVWNANAPKSPDINPYTTHFVGTSKCDVLGTDLYMFGDEPFKQEYYDGLEAISGGKPIGVAEIGQLFPITIFNTQPKWAWFMEWGNYLYDYNTQAQRDALFTTSVSRTLNRSEVHIIPTPPPTPDTQAPSTPTNLTSPSKTATSAYLTWTASTDNIGVTGYEVYTNETILTGTTTVTNFSVNGLTANTSYRFKVRAKDAAGNFSAFSTSLIVTTDSINTNFVRGINFGGPAVTIEGQNWLAGNNSLITYSANVKTYINSPAITPVPAVDSATSTMLNSNIYASASDFTVTQPLPNGSYQLYLWSLENYQANSRSFHVFLEGVQVTTAPIGGLSLNSWAKYGPYSVTVTDGILNMDVRRVTGDPGLTGMAILSSAGADTQAPSTPTNLIVKSKTSTSVSLSWTASTDNVGVTGYDIYNGNTIVGSTTIPSFTVTGLVAGTAYSFSVRAKDAAGNQSLNSASISVTTSKGDSLIMINAADYGATPIEVTPNFDSTSALNNSLTQAVTSGVELYIPPGTYRTTASIIASGNNVMIRGAGGTETVIKPDSSAYDAIVIGKNSAFSSSGNLRDLAVKGPTARPSGFKAGVKIDEMRQFEISNVTVDNYDIGFDFVNNCFGSMTNNLRTGYGVNVGINLRTGTQSGNDLLFINSWLYGEVAAVQIANDSGGFQFIGGQFSNNQNSGTTVNDNRGVMTLGKDYISGTMGGVANVFVQGVDFEGLRYCWAVRGFDQISLSINSCGIQPYDAPAIGFMKMTNAKQSKVTLMNQQIRGQWSGSQLLSVAGQYDDCSILELNGWIDATIAGTAYVGSSILKQSRIEMGQSIFRANNHNTLQLGSTLLQESGAGNLQVSADWGTTWNTISPTSLIVTAPNGKKYTIGVTNKGVLTATLIN